MLQALVTLIGCASGDAAAIKEADVAALKAAMASEAVVIDVRSPGEFASGHVPGATNIPISDLSGRLDELRPHGDAEIWLICRSGGRSMKAAGILADAGMTPINVTGGTLAWTAAGYAVE